MRGWRAILTLAGVLTVAAVGAGCGGDGSSEVTASANVDKATFLKQVEAVCKQANARTQAGWEDFVKDKGGDPTAAFEDQDDANEFSTTVVLAEKQRQVDELAELTAPEEDKEQFEAILAAYEEGIEVGEDDPETVTSAQGVFKYAASLAEKYGVPECRW